MPGRSVSGVNSQNAKDLANNVTKGVQKCVNTIHRRLDTDHHAVQTMIKRLQELDQEATRLTTRLVKMSNLKALQKKEPLTFGGFCRVLPDRCDAHCRTFQSHLLWHEHFVNRSAACIQSSVPRCVFGTGPRVSAMLISIAKVLCQ
eukprot:9491626-Pyramimonas_sp.AAC.2